MSKINTTFGLLSRTGLVLSGAVALCIATTAFGPVSAQELQVKFDGKEFEIKRNSIRRQNPVIGTTKGDREEDGNGKKVFPQVAIGKGDTEEGGSSKKRFPRIATGKGDRDDDKPKSQQIVIGKGDQAEDNEPPKKRQVIVEPKPKKKKIVQSEPKFEPTPKKLKKLALATEPAAPKQTNEVVIADAESAGEESPAVETPAEESTTENDAPVTEETPAEAPKQTFEVGQIVTAADGNQYIVVKVNEASVSVMPLSAYVAEEPVRKVYKKKRHKKRYYSSRSYSYGGSSCH